MKKTILLLILLFSFFVNAQKAITVTAQLKSANKELFKANAINSIKQLSGIPNSFFSLVYNPGQRTDGYHTLNVSVHIGDGFADVITPSYDASINRLGVIFYDASNTVFTFSIIALTQLEQDDYQQNIEDNDASSQSIQKYKNDGVIGFDRAMALIQRRFDNGVITPNQAKGLAQGLYPDLEPLYKGMWRLVKANLDGVTPPTNADLLQIFNIIKNGVDNYVANNY